MCVYIQINYYTSKFQKITPKALLRLYPHIIHVINDNIIRKQNACYNSMCLYPDF